MSFAELMMTGMQLMLLGMGIVFSFLLLLVATMNGMSRLAVMLESRQPVAANVSGGTDDALIAVISAAIKRYRDTH